MQNTLSVITICYNNLDELIKTCNSVDTQSHAPSEHIIVDGSTNKEIYEWLTNTQQPNYRTWIHERDKGISDAFNKGLKTATGSITHLLNSGDTYYVQNAIEKVINHFEEHVDLMWVHTKYVQHRGNINIVTGLPFEKEKLWKGMRTVAHPSMFIKMALYHKHGLYNLNYKIAMDFDFLVRIRDEKFDFLPYPIVYFAPGGVSNNQLKMGQKEVKEISEKYLGKDWRFTLWQLRKVLLEAVMKTKFGKIVFQIKNRKNSSK